MEETAVKVMQLYVRGHNILIATS